MGRFQDLEVWCLAKDLAKLVYKVSTPEKFQNDFGLMDQFRRACISISSNIAEGEEAGTLKSGLNYLRIAKASNAELRSQSIIACDIGFITQEENSEILKLSNLISKKLFFLIKYRKSLLNKK